MDNDVITISADKEFESKDEKETCTKEEYSYLTFSRSFTLPETADISKIQAKSEDGILKITISKKEEAKVIPAREIEIK